MTWYDKGICTSVNHVTGEGTFVKAPQPPTTTRTIPKLPPLTEFQLTYEAEQRDWYCAITPECAGPMAEGTGSSPRAAVNRALKQLKYYEKEGMYA